VAKLGLGARFGLRPLAAVGLDGAIPSTSQSGTASGEVELGLLELSERRVVNASELRVCVRTRFRGAFVRRVGLSADIADAIKMPPERAGAKTSPKPSSHAETP